MMKKTFFILFALMIFVSISLHAQVNYKFQENTYQRINVTLTFGALKNIDIETEEGVFSRVFIEGCAGSHHIGEPELPVAVSTLEIPVGEDYVLNVFGNDFTIYSAAELGINEPVYPAQPSVSKSHEGQVVFLQNKNIYQTDAFYALPLAKFEMIGMMRNINLGQLYVSPVQYNPVTKEIKIYKSVDVEILFIKPELVKTRMLKDLHKTPLFRPSNILNPMENGKPEFEHTPIKYLIVAHSMFRGVLDEFITWKKRKGFLVETGYTDDENVGTTTASIAAFIKSHYDNATPENPAPTFVLLVGDVQQIPAFKGTEGTHPTDLYYFTWAGGNLPCCYYGRFSAQKIEQLIPQLEKTLQYEQYTMPDPSYLNNTCLIAGYDKTYASVWGNGLVNYITKLYATTEYGYKNVYKHIYPDSSSPQEIAQIREEIGAGVGIANYTAHGSILGWDNPSFNTGHIKNMKNENRYGLIIGNCCFSNKFDSSECFGEALLRVEKKGAAGYIGGSNNTYWDEDFFWGVGCKTPHYDPNYDPNNLGAYDRLFHTHGEDYNEWMVTFGSMIKAGNEAVQASNSDLKKYYWEIYHLMGDPSVMTYLTKPSPMNVSVTSHLLLGDSILSAKVAPYSYCAFTDNSKERLCAGFADADGNITFRFHPVETSKKYEFTAWAQNHIQYFKTIYSGDAGIDSDSDSFNALIYPNPTYGELRVMSYELRVMSVEVFDIYGKKQLSHHLITTSSHHHINISNLPAGVYFVKIYTDKGETIKKIVKK